MKHHLYPTFASIAILVLLLAYLTDFNTGRSNYFSPHLALDGTQIPAGAGLAIRKDSLDKIEKWQKARIGAVGYPGSSISAGFIGVKYFAECDTCMAKQFRNGGTTDKYYLELPGYYLREDESAAAFFEQHNFYVGHTGPRFSFSPGFPANAGSMLIPLKHSTYKTVKVLIQAWTVIMVLVFLYFVIASPVKVLVNIAQGRPFDRSNHRILQRAGWVLIAAALIVPLFSLVLNLLFSSAIPGEVNYYFWNELLKFNRFLIIGIGVLIISHAFRRGHVLQEDQNLMI